MKLNSKKSFLYLFLVVAFCVAVSGGCGGGSSSHFSGDYAITSDDVTPPVESDDVNPPVPDNPASDDVPPAPEIPTSDDIPPVSGITPVPEEFTSDDKFGNNDDWEVVSYFSALHNTEWYVQSVNVSVADTFANCTITPNSYNYNANKLKLQVFNDSAIAFIDADEMWRGNWYSPLTVQFKDPSGNELSAPILRAAGGVTHTRSTEYYDMWGVNFGNDGNQLFDIYKKIPPTYIIVYNNFAINNVWYRTIIELRPYNNSANNDEYGAGDEWAVIDDFTMLDGTKWVIFDTTVLDANNNNCNLVPNSYNPSAYNDNTAKLTLRMFDHDFAWADNKGNLRGSKALTVNFIDPSGNTRTAPLLRPAANFWRIEDGNEITYESDEIRAGENERFNLLAGQNSTINNIIVVNDFYIGNTKYKSSIMLMKQP